MYMTATAIFIAGITGGTAWGIAYTDSVLHIAVAAAVGGFAGSAAGAVCFAAMYLYSSKKEGDGSGEPGEEDMLSIVEPDPVPRLSGPSEEKPVLSEEKRRKEIEKELKRLKKKQKKKKIS